MPIHKFVLVTSNNRSLVYDKEFYFSLLDAISLKNNTIIENCNILGIVNLDDDIFSYFKETFLWVIGINNNTPISLAENRWGVTVLDTQCQLIFSEVVAGFIKIFSVAPESILIFGDFIFNDDMTDGDYEKIYISKQDIVNTLNILKSFIDKLSAEGYYLIHLGI